MKKLLLFLLLVLSQYAVADYNPLLVDGKTFSYAVFDNFDGHRVEYVEITLHETTTFNNLSYWVVDDDLLREDAANMRVYIVPKYMQGNTTEYLLYDFGVQQGDELHIFQPLAFYEEPYEEGNLYFLNESPAIVTDVSEEGGKRRIEVNVKKYVGDDSETINRLTWIEGIGNKSTLLGNGGDIPGIVASRSNHLLLCVSTGGELIYRTEAGETYGCDGLGTALTDVPADELLTIKGGVLTLKGVAEGTASTVFTPDGQRVITFTGDKADISALPSGLYIIRTGTLTAKFVK